MRIRKIRTQDNQRVKRFIASILKKEFPEVTCFYSENDLKDIKRHYLGKRERFFVVGFDPALKEKAEKDDYRNHFKELKIGSEIVLAIPPDAVGYTIPKVMDYSRDNFEQYLVLHSTEVTYINSDVEVLTEQEFKDMLNKANGL